MNVNVFPQGKTLLIPLSIKLAMGLFRFLNLLFFFQFWGSNFWLIFVFFDFWDFLYLVICLGFESCSCSFSFSLFVLFLSIFFSFPFGKVLLSFSFSFSFISLFLFLFLFPPSPHNFFVMEEKNFDMDGLLEEDDHSIFEEKQEEKKDNQMTGVRVGYCLANIARMDFNLFGFYLNPYLLDAVGMDPSLVGWNSFFFFFFFFFFLILFFFFFFFDPFSFRSLFLFSFLLFLSSFFFFSPSITVPSQGMLLLSRQLWDAFSDPIVGHLSDNTKTKWGRRRPWIVCSFPFLGVSWILFWTMLSDLGETCLFFVFCFLFFYFVSFF